MLVVIILHKLILNSWKWLNKTFPCFLGEIPCLDYKTLDHSASLLGCDASACPVPPALWSPCGHELLDPLCFQFNHTIKGQDSISARQNTLPDLLHTSARKTLSLWGHTWLWWGLSLESQCLLEFTFQLRGTTSSLGRAVASHTAQKATWNMWMLLQSLSSTAAWRTRRTSLLIIT